ncbi:hypothetical protein [Amycolatopsis sp. FDAARGOS 1241]|uniref:hypothetical protein n=1 Tax=Amycolatopsis sp. FDAARGOS 1241 TaxID=2778070 RepID=UPI001950FEC7|nr:hypothetical protein [Amycolatopsis sp. FDAARGOS 1241]QRP48007.1 hypothetical protein I6J71_09020 [Amycolatopsis sp. FDAARGOS 1241]
MVIELSLATGIAPRHIAELDLRSIDTMAYLIDQHNKAMKNGKPSGTGEVPSRYGSAQLSG